MKTIIFCFLFVLGFNYSISAQGYSLVTKQEKVLDYEIDSSRVEHFESIITTPNRNLGIFPSFSGIIYNYNGDYKKAATCFNNAIKLRIKLFGENTPLVANSYRNLGRMYIKLGLYEKAINYYTKALNIELEWFNEDPDVAYKYNNIGTAYYRLGDYQKAATYIKKAINILDEIPGNRKSKAIVYINLGLSYHKLGINEKANSSFYIGLNILIEKLGKKHSKVALLYGFLGVEHYVLGDYEKAITFHKKSLNILVEKSDKNHPLGESYDNLGKVYSKLGDYEKAATCFKKALNILLKKLGKKHSKVALIYNNLGDTYSNLGDYKNAIAFYEKSLNIKQEKSNENPLNIVALYNNLGLTYGKFGDYEKAIIFLDKVLDIKLELLGKKHSEVANSYKNLGVAYLKIGDPERAIIFFDKALSAQIDALGENRSSLSSIYNNLVFAYQEIDNFKTADSLWHIVIPERLNQLKSIFIFLPNDQRIKYSNTLTSMNSDFYSFATKKGSKSVKQLATNFLLNTKSLALDYAVSTSQLIKELKDTTLITQYHQANKLNKQLADSERLTSEERKEKGWNLFKIQEEREAIVFQMLQHPQLRSKLDTEIVEWQDIQNHLTNDEATIDFLRIYEKKDSVWAYYGIVINKKHSNPQFIRISDEETLIALLKTNEESHPEFINKRSSRKMLHRILWQSLEPYLKDIKTVHLSPTNLLHRVPFESLQDQDNEFLAEQYEIHYYSAIRDMLKEKPEKTKFKDMVLMGHILYDLDHKENYKEEEDIFNEGKRNIRNGIQPIPQTLEEVKSIVNESKKAGLETTLLTIDAASEDTIQHFVQEQAPSIFHFATHGVFLPPLNKENPNHLTSFSDRLRAADNPLQRSALMLYGANETWTKGRKILGSSEDGILTALEVTMLDLQNTDLVVLSACATGLGNIHNTEGVFGLQRAFKLAGVNYVIASLWDVDDTATKDLMVAFYDNLLQKKEDPARALRNAKEKLKADGYEPVDWSGFILIE